jgi:ribosomal protein L28
MARSCDICHKTYNKAQYLNKLRGQYNRAGIKIQKANLQKKKVGGVQMLLCTKCIKNLSKIKRKRTGNKKKA